MSKIDTDSLVDLFKEEATKIEKKDLKKKKKKEKKLEKKENFEFKKLTEIKDKKIKQEDNLSVTNFLYDTFFGFCLILLLFVTIGFIYFNLKNNTETKYIIQTILLGIFVIAYIHSNVIKNNNLKKFSAIIAAISISSYMIYTLYYFT